MKRWFAALVGSIALVACGIVHGFWTDRWSPPVETAQAAERLNAIPLELGDWDGEALEVKPGEAGNDVAGCIKRTYVHRKTGVTVSLFLVCGRWGPVSVHTPEVCYGASGFLLNAKARYDLASGDTLWKTDATRTNATEQTRLRLYWGWSDGSAWTAAVDARRQFARRPVLHKLYVVRELSGLNEPPGREPCEEFLNLLVPALRKTMFAPS
ncbi:MAG TPA: exosortase-associated EpsI family protein [Gemmataceae bacterium]|nr:exosortase-associated EpsI family protein [Gemmataceae bacterium]